jgi:hypothetical protein
VPLGRLEQDQRHIDPEPPDRLNANLCRYRVFHGRSDDARLRIIARLGADLEGVVRVDVSAEAGDARVHAAATVLPAGLSGFSPAHADGLFTL